MPETGENWLGLQQLRLLCPPDPYAIYQVLLYSGDFKITGELQLKSTVFLFGIRDL